MWNHVVTKKVLDKSKHIMHIVIKILDLRFFKVTTLCLDDSFAQTLGILSTSFMRNTFPTVLKEFPHIVCWAVVECFSITLRPKSSQTISIGLKSAVLHHSPSWSNSPYTTWRCVLGHCPVEKQMIVPLCAWLSVPWILNKSQTVSPASNPTHHTSSSMLHGGNHTCRDHPFNYSTVHKDSGWNQKSQIWTHQTKGQIFTGLMSIARISWP